MLCPVPQHLRSELKSLEVLLKELGTQAEALYPTAPQERVEALKEELHQLQQRWSSQTTALANRLVS